MKKYNVTEAATIRYPYGRQAMSREYWADRKLADLRARLRAEANQDRLLFNLALAGAIISFAVWLVATAFQYKLI